MTTGTLASAYICWGDNNPVSPESTNNWDTVVVMGSVTNGEAFNTAVSLDTDTTYYYSCFVTNALGADWSSVESFTTPIRLPQTLYWEGANTGGVGDGDGASAGGTATWDRSTKNWDDGSDRVIWGIEDSAIFGGSAGTVTLGADVSVSNITVSVDNYEITGSDTLTLVGTGVINNVGSATISAPIAGDNGLTKTGSDKLTLSGANTYTGGTTLDGGTLEISADNNLGDSGGDITVCSDTRINIMADISAARAIELESGATLLFATAQKRFTTTGPLMRPMAAQAIYGSTIPNWIALC